MDSQRTSVHDLTYDQLDLLRQQAVQNGGRAEVINTFTAPAPLATAGLPAGIQYFDYDPVGRVILPEYTPITNTMPRVPGKGMAVYVREITNFNAGFQTLGVSEGNRGGTITRTTRDKMFKFCGLGLENVNTFEAKYAALGLAGVNIEELARRDATIAYKTGLEHVVLGSNRTHLLGTPTAPAGVPSAGGAMTARTIKGRIVALTYQGSKLSTVATGVATVINRTNADASVDTFGGGSSQKSAASADVVVGANEKVSWAWADVPGAVKYAVYTGLAGAERLAAIVSTNEWVQTADESGATQTAASITADNSLNALEMDGILTLVDDPANNTYRKSMDGAVLTSSGADGNIQQLLEAFYYFYTASRTSPTSLIVPPLVALAITRILLTGPMKDIYAKYVTTTDKLVGGMYVSAVLNPFTGTVVPIVVHWHMPEGMILLKTDSLPYPVEKLGNIWELQVRQPLYGIKWPGRTRRDEFGLYEDLGLACQLLEVQGLIKNIEAVL